MVERRLNPADIVQIGLDAIEVLEPPWLRSEIASRFERAAARNRGAPPGV